MNRRQILGRLLGAALAIALSTTPALAADLTVTVTYTGKGKVDAQHDILVFLFATPNINAESVPMTVQSVPMSGGTATFKGLVQDPVYVVMVFNEKADYSGTDGPPPDGLPWAIHSMGGKPVPVSPAKTPQVKTTFDDSRRWGR
jgi:hypothetical protein